MTTRPDWASSEAFEGWAGNDAYIRRKSASDQFTIYRHAELFVEQTGGSVAWCFNSPNDALEVANLIAEKLDGWVMG
jgi:hypothetical protein